MTPCITALLIASSSWLQPPNIRSVADLEKALSGDVTPEAANAAAIYLRRSQPRDGARNQGAKRQKELKNAKSATAGPDLTRGALSPPQGRGKVVWFLEETPRAKVEVMAKSGEKWALKPLADAGLHVTVASTPTIVRYDFQYQVDGQDRGRGRVEIESYDLPLDCLQQPNVPQGKVVKMPAFVSTKAYPDCSHEWWMYIPEGREKGDDSLALMVFLDGKSYIDGDCPTPPVFDNLSHQKKMPPCVGVFVQPGTKAGRPPNATRSDEYDTCTPRFAEFLEKELLPEALKTCRFSSDPKRRAICGASSGGSGAFTAAWHRPDLFHRVLSQIGSFCDFRSLESYPSFDGRVRPDVERLQTWKVAHDYPALIRKTRPAKPIRVFMQEGERDLDNQLGDWPLANRQMAKALEFAGYKHKLVMGQGFHNRKHGRAILPDSLIWLWADD